MEKEFRADVESTEPAPPYEENDLRSKPVEKSTQRSPYSPTAQERAAELRQQRVRLLVDGHIQPLIETAILDGSDQTIIIVASDALQTSSVLTANNLVHRPKSSSIQIVQLQGPNSNTAFWTQSKVVEDLETAIRSSIYGPHEALQSRGVLPPRPREISSPTTGQKSWLKRTFGMPGPEHDPTGSTGDWKLGWRSEHTNTQRPPRQHEHSAFARVQDVAFRTETELGLLTTTTARCIVVKFEGELERAESGH